ncbi:MAG: hypothetical protein AVDCRST_MAG26-181, partial [uncultured Chloroflexia bacterium]
SSRALTWPRARRRRSNAGRGSKRRRSPWAKLRGVSVIAQA